jgi:tripartite-type tricarboxylate transporter receptor subunit TctC
MDALRRLLVLSGLGFGLKAAAAQDAWPAPGRPIRMVVPAPPGGPGDVVARMLARELGERMKTAVVVDNKPGGASIPGAMDVARAAPDGHTLLLTLNTTHTQVPHLYARVPFDPFADFTPIAPVYRGHSVLVAHPSFPAANLAEAIARSREQTVAFGSPSPGTTGHLYIEILNADHGARFVHVPYKGSSPAQQDLLAGHIALLFDSPATALPHVRTGRLKALASTGPTRLSALADVPTAREQGLSGLDRGTWLGVFGPARLPDAIVARLNQEIVQALESSQLRAQFAALGVELASGTPGDFAELIRADHQHWGRVIRRIGLRLDG